MNIEYSVILIDRIFLQSQLSNYKILRKVSPLIIRGIESNRYITTEYINLDIYISSHHSSDSRPIKVLLKHIAFVIDNLRAKILISIDILAAEDVNLIIFTYINFIDSYNTTFQLTITLSIRFFIR